MYLNIIDEQLKNMLCNSGCEIIATYKAGDKKIWVFNKSTVEFALKKETDLAGKAFVSDRLVIRFE